MYIRELAETYDDIYQARGRDYAAEAARVAEVIRERNPGAATLLDAPCGTGAHLRHFAERFAHVEGVELSPDMRRVAARRLPGVTISAGDLRGFSLGRAFDAVTCLFAISHMACQSELEAAIGCLAGHLAPGGVLVVEPWWQPDGYAAGHVAGDLVDGPRTVARVSHSVREGRRVHTEVHCLVADSETGVRHASETFSLTLFSDAEYTAAFAAAGLGCERVTGAGGNSRLLVGSPG
ncbi:class I SAM-dependent methyltransferase [Nonomuraea sp. CA-218870]|uniref:class I SAM-dependent methyltransferase n=1 Tax=Nonomuraea sp. CA-218870 TaxID=3239998 RepID=UPI003D933901